MRKFFFVSSSHLDREWYQSYEAFRIHIADIFFRVFDLLETSDAFCSFMVDGQMSVLDDYLEIYPEEIHRVRRLAQANRLLLGPWYTQPDEFLVDGESHIRNLETGMKMAKKLGNVMQIGYLPDSFGHISQMPQILNGFGIEKAFIMRGVDKKRAQEFLWKSPNGSCVRTIQNIYGNCNIPITPDTKEFGTGILQTASEIGARLKQLDASTDCATLSDRKLVTYCNDHSAPSAQFDAIMSELAQNGFDVYVGSLEQYFSTVPWKDVSACITGELREGADIPLLRETVVSRPYLKRENQIAQKKLIHQAEPMLALARLQGISLSGAFLAYAWKLLLQNHAHDSICGCSIDDVHDEMMMRYRKLEQVADNQIQKAGNAFLDTLVLPAADKHEAVILLVNTSGVSCNYAEAAIVWPADANYQSFCILDADGKEVAFQILGQVEEHQINSDIDCVQRFQHMVGFRVLIAISHMPQYGSLMYRVRFLEHAQLCHAPAAPMQMPALENEFLCVRFHENGTFSVRDKGTGTTYNGLHYFLDDGTNGDVYSFREVGDTPIDSRKLSWELVQNEDGPLMQSVTLKAKMRLPCCMIGQKERASQLVENTLSYRVSLKKKSRQLDIHLCVENRARDHRLRLMLPTYTGARAATSDAPYAFEERCASQFPDYHPMQSFVHVRGTSAGVAFLSRGLHQYQLLQDDVSTLAITLHHGRSRLFSWLDWNDRRFDGIQCQGKNEFDYAVYFCAPEDQTGDVYDRARTFQCEPVAMQRTGVLPLPVSKVWNAVTTETRNVKLSSFRMIDPACVELRVLNPTDRETTAHMRFGFVAKTIRKTDLAGKTLETYPGGPELSLSIGPAQICTLRFDLETHISGLASLK